MVINMGPQHPSTHGVLRLVIEVDGETIVGLAPDIGYLHTGIEKTCEAKFYQQVVPLTDRIDYLSPMTNNTAYALAVEKLLGLEIPPKAQWLRVLFKRADAPELAPGVAGNACDGYWRADGLSYCFREREQLLRIFEAVSGQRMMTSYVRIGGLSLEPPRDLYDKIRTFLKDFPGHIDEYEGLLQNNPIWMNRLKGVGLYLAGRRDCAGVSGPPLRAAGIDFDVRRDMPYSSYEKFQFNVPTSTVSDVWARYIVRMQEMRESVKICLQALDGMPEGRIVADAPKIILPDREQMKTQMESLIHHFKIVTEGFGVPAGEATSSVEAAHGLMYYYVVSDGTAKPYRVHMRNADYANLQALETMCKGRLLADVVAVIGSIDIVLGAIDR
ncbi:MAG: NADH dehydrogenase (quinone) subunit D [Edaphobacter sp.]